MYLQRCDVQFVTVNGAMVVVVLHATSFSITSARECLAILSTFRFERRPLDPFPSGMQLDSTQAQHLGAKDNPLPVCLEILDANDKSLGVFGVVCGACDCADCLSLYPGLPGHHFAGRGD